VLDAGDRIKFLKNVFGDGEVARDGINIAFSCPNCKTTKNKKKLIVRIDTGQWHCWVCETKGRSVPSLLKTYAKSYYQAWVSRFESAEFRKVFFDDENTRIEEIEIPDGLTIDELVVSKDPDAKAILNYLTQRGIDEDLSYRFRLIGCTKGRLRRRIVIPSFDSMGKINYWTARTIDKDSKVRYVNPKIDRKTIIFNEVDVDWKKEVLLVEGPFDLMKATDNTVALLGSTLPQDSLLFKRIIENNTPVILALDSDALSKSHKIARTLYQHNIKVKFLEIRGNIDIGEMSRSEFESFKKNAFEWHPVNRLIYKINNISSGSIF
jgi:DNA primase/ribosomal protein L37AE/L43A